MLSGTWNILIVNNFRCFFNNCFTAEVCTHCAWMNFIKTISRRISIFIKKNAVNFFWCPVFVILVNRWIKQTSYLFRFKKGYIQLYFIFDCRINSLYNENFSINSFCNSLNFQFLCKLYSICPKPEPLFTPVHCVFKFFSPSRQITCRTQLKARTCADCISCQRINNPCKITVIRCFISCIRKYFLSYRLWCFSICTQKISTLPMLWRFPAPWCCIKRLDNRFLFFLFE